MTDQEPVDPISELRQLAAQIHELYLEWVAAGFTETQALDLCKAVLVANAGGAAK